MQLHVIRTTFTDQSSVGELYLNGAFYCYTLEDVDRDLRADLPLDAIRARKIFAQTAIPTGNYEIILNWSNRFQKQMPLLLRVPGWEGVRIHSGNYPHQTEGCILLGKTKLDNMVGVSNKTFEAFMVEMRRATKREKIHIEIESRKTPLAGLVATQPMTVPAVIAEPV